MKRILSLLLAILLLLSCMSMLLACDDETPDEGTPPADGGEAGPPADPKKIPKIIYDTDMDTDCDDAGGLALLLEYVKAGKAELLGVVADVPSPYAAPCCDYFCRYYGVEVPVGTVYAAKADEDPAYWEGYRNFQLGIVNREGDYNRVFANRIGKVDTDYPSAARVYREILAAAEDKSVIVVAVGLMTALQELFLSGPDEISPLTGVELFEQKVERVVSMGHAEGLKQSRASFNYLYDSVAAETFFALCPVPVYVSGEGRTIEVGGTYSGLLPQGHPLRESYEIYCGRDRGRKSWDLICVLYAMDTESKLFKTKTQGTVKYTSQGDILEWKEYNGKRADYLVELKAKEDTICVLLEKQTKGIFD
ncbi:MAG: nucleoside hydrolase [Clostridia bacterium]|nr:nucleoside hydrolase [Clostridia bacterium]